MKNHSLISDNLRNHVGLMIYWAPFLHFYQPPIQFHAVLKKICDESYRPLLKIFSEQANAKVTINICGVLTELLNDHGAKDILADIKQLAEAGKLEFVESAKYHPILPLIPPKEVQRQIDLNHKANSYFFREAYAPRGFFSPEMCYSNGLASILSTLDYDWLLISGAACSEPWPLDLIYKIPFGKNELVIFYRDDVLSNKISFKSIDSDGFVSELIALSEDKEDIYVITAMDAETFGHHVQHWEELFLEEVYETLEIGVAEYSRLKQKADLAESHKGILDSDVVGKIEVVTISELLKLFPIKVSKSPHPSSWSTNRHDIQRGNYYPLWKDDSNPIHRLQWEHLDICFELVDAATSLEGNKESQNFAEISRALLDRATHSCQFWWANKGRMWDINLVNKGLMLQEEVLLNVYKAISISDSSSEVKRQSHHNLVAARDIANKIRDQLLIP